VPGQLGLGHFGRFAIGLNDDLRRLLGVIWPAGDHFAPARLSHRALPRSMPGGLPPRFIRNIGDLGSYLDPINAIVMAMSVLITRRLLRQPGARTFTRRQVSVMAIGKRLARQTPNPTVMRWTGHDTKSSGS
jgi:hypothetical protein